MQKRKNTTVILSAHFTGVKPGLALREAQRLGKLVNWWWGAYLYETRRWRKKHKLHALYSSPKSIRMISLKKMRWTTHVTRTPEKYIHIYIEALFYAFFMCALTPLCQFTFLSLCPLIFGLALFGLFISIYFFFNFLYRFLFTPAFSWTQLGRKTRSGCTTFWRTACGDNLISDLTVDRAVILKFTVKGTGRNGWSGFMVHNEDHWRVPVNTVINNGAP